MKDKFIHWLWNSRKINAGQYLWLKRVLKVKEEPLEKIVKRYKEANQ